MVMILQLRNDISVCMGWSYWRSFLCLLLAGEFLRVHLILRIIDGTD